MSGHCLLTVSALAAVMHQAPKEEHVDAFHDYMHKYDRRYQNGSDEYHQRLALFAQSRSVVAAQNARPGRRWTATLNALADRTEGELGQLRGWRGGVAAGGAGAPGGASGLMQRVGTFLSQRGRGRALPQEFMNWTKLRSARSSDQGECGSCWAVTSSEILRMHMEIYSPSSNRTFSAQELVSCVPNPHECGGSGGCQGATVELAFHWTQSQGLAQESETPYMASDVKCKKSGGLLQLSTGGSNEDVTAVGVHKAPADSPAAAFGMVGFERLAENGYEALLRGVVERGPVAISVAAKMWSFYSSGLFDSCGEDWEINHAVALVGYGKDETSGELFYLVQNSWGSDWGENGRIRILRRESDGEHCGMDTQPLLGTGCKGGPKQVRVCGPCGILYDNVVPHFKRLGQ